MVIPEEPADNPDLRIGQTKLNVAHVKDHQAVRPERRIVRRHAEVAGLPRVHPRAVLVGGEVMGPAIAGERPVEEPLRVVRVGHVDNGHDAAHAAKALADVVRLAVLGPATHVAGTIGHVECGRQFRVSAVLV